MEANIEITVDPLRVQPQWSEVPTTRWFMSFASGLSTPLNCHGERSLGISTLWLPQIQRPPGKMLPLFFQPKWVYRNTVTPESNGSSFSPDPDWHPRPLGARSQRVKPPSFASSLRAEFDLWPACRAATPHHPTLGGRKRWENLWFSPTGVSKKFHPFPCSNLDQLHGGSPCHPSHPPESPGGTHQPIRLIIWAGAWRGGQSFSWRMYHLVLPKSTRMISDVGPWKIQGTLFSCTLSNSVQYLGFPEVQGVSLFFNGWHVDIAAGSLVNLLHSSNWNLVFFLDSDSVTPILTIIPVALLTKLVCVTNCFWGSSRLATAEKGWFS